MTGLSSRFRPRLPWLLAIVVLCLAWRLGHGPAGWVYLALFAVWLLPGVPIAALIFGRHPAAVIAGAAIGYPLTGLLLWIPVAVGVPRPGLFAAVWIAATAPLWLALWPRRRNRIDMPAWSRRDTAALTLVLLLVPALVGRPFTRIGEPDASGARQYRAYFTADFLWHMALTAELEKFTRPPRNPYLDGEALHYYWLHFLPPAVAGATLGGVLPDRVGRLTINDLGTGLIFIATLFLFAWTVCGGGAAAAGWAAGLAVVASSAEGLYLIQRHLRAGVALAAIRDINVDAVTAWFFGSFTIDGLQRSLMYNPQHSMSCAAGLIALAVAARAGARMTAGVAGIAGLALGFALMLSPFAGGALTLAFALSIAAGLVADRRGWPARALALCASALPVLVALAWCAMTLTFEGAAGDVRLGLYPRVMAAPMTSLALAAGPVLVPAAIGLAAAPRFSTEIRPAFFGLAIGLILLFFVSLRSADVWVGWRAGQVILITAPAMTAVGLSRLFASTSGRAAGVALVVLVAAVGVPTSVLDVVNAQDVTNRGMGPQFAWTVLVTRPEQEALDWIRGHTRPRDVVQMEPTSRGRETWTLIPAFAERRMSAGLPISLLARPEYEIRSRDVRALYETHDPELAFCLAQTLGIDYVYVDRIEREHFPEADTKFSLRPDLFMPVFANSEVRIFWVQ